MGSAQGLGMFTWQDWFLGHPLVVRLLGEGVKRRDIFIVRKAFYQAAAADDGEDVIEDVVPGANMNDTAVKAADELFIDGTDATDDTAGVGMQYARVGYVNDQGDFAHSDNVTIAAGGVGNSTGITDAFYVNTIQGVVFGTDLDAAGTIRIQDDIAGTNVFLSQLLALNGDIMDGTLRFYVGTAGQATIVSLHAWALVHDVYVRNQFTDLGPVSTTRATMKMTQIPLYANVKDTIMEYYELAGPGQGIHIGSNQLWELTLQNFVNTEDGIVEGIVEIVYWNKHPRAVP